MKRSLVIVLAVLALASLSAGAFATTYYVATNGNDSNPGTSTQPWATLQKAVNTINPGDTALVRPGTYLGCRISRSGQAGAVCTLAAETPGTVTINAPGPSNTKSSLIEVELYDSTVRYWVLDGFVLANSPHHGFDVRGTEYITVRNSVAYGTTPGTGIFFAFSYYNTVQNCETYNNAEHGIYQSNSGDYYTARGNLIHDNMGCGQHMNGDRRMKPGDGLISFVVFEQNAVWGNGTNGGSAINCDGVMDGIFRNNLVYNNKAFGLALFKTDGASGSSRNKVYNNTFVQAANSRDVVWIPSSNPAPTANLIKNNILYTPDTDECCIAVYGTAALASGGSDYNATTDIFSVNGGKKYINLTTWRSYGFDAHSFISNPTQLFVDPANSNYHLRAGSPAANTGTTLTEVTNDFDGEARPQSGSYDIGCYEDW